MYEYATHEEVPIMLRNYLVSISGVSVFDKIRLFDINDFLNGLEDYYGAVLDENIIREELERADILRHFQKEERNNYV